VSALPRRSVVVSEAAWKPLALLGAASLLGRPLVEVGGPSLGLRIAHSLGINTLALPWTLQAHLASWGDPSKPFCVGVQVRPLWDDCKQYTGHCRYGAPLGGMRAAIAAMDRRRAAGQAREDGLAGNLVDHLQTELNTIAGLGVVAGQNRLKRDAVSQTVAAKDPNDDKKPSFTKRAAVNCAIWGSAFAGLQALADFAFDGKPPNKTTAKVLVVSCIGAVISTPLNKFIKSKGYGMDDDE
jgi:hypothetical protein